MSATHDDDAPPGLPDTLPVLPLRDTVTYPDTLTPLAVGQDNKAELAGEWRGRKNLFVEDASWYIRPLIHASNRSFGIVVR